MSEEWDEKKDKKDGDEVVSQISDKKLVKLDAPPEVAKKVNPLVMSVEEYAKILTEGQRAALREQRISRFPNLFDIRGFNEDILSSHPLVEMSNEARLYTSLFEGSLRAKLRKAKKKKVEH
jgi:hypothetical protein